MASIKRPYQDALYQALNVYRDATRSFIVRNLQSVGGMNLQEAIEKSLSREERLENFQRALRKVRGNDDGNNPVYVSEIESSIDVNMFSDIICHHWHSTFATIFNDDMGKVSEAFTEINRTRNDMFHPGLEDISSGRAQSTLQRMSRILSKAKAYAAMDEVDRILETLSENAKQTAERVAEASRQDQPETVAIAEVVADSLSTLIKEQRVDTDELAERTAERVARMLEPEQPSPSEIADEMLRRLSPVLTPLSESPIATQTAIDAAVIERLERLTSPSEIAEQAAGKVASLLQEQGDTSTEILRQVRYDLERIADVLESAQVRPEDSTDSTAESIKQLGQGFEALAQQVSDALERLQAPKGSGRPAPARPAKVVNPAHSDSPSIEERWTNVQRDLNRTKGREAASLGGLLRGSRPVDIWLNLDGGKLMLPFKSEVVLGMIREELTYPAEIQETIAATIVQHFGKPLEIEPILLNQSG